MDAGRVEELIELATSRRFYFPRTVTRLPVPAVASLSFICRQIKCTYAVEWRAKRPHVFFRLDPDEFRKRLEIFREEKGEEMFQKVLEKAAGVMAMWQQVDKKRAKLAATEAILAPFPVFSTEIIEAEEVEA